jgi:hypothetical protein
MKESSAIINALINTSGIVGVQMFGYEWAVYPAMALISMLIFAQTLGSGYLLVRPDTRKSNETSGDISPSITIMISVLYAGTAYQTYLLGYSIFAGMAFAHAAIMFFTGIFKENI